MDPILLQKQLKNNNQDVLDFCEDLKSWGEEMRKKEQKLSTQNKQTTNESMLPKEQSQKVKPIKTANETKESSKKCTSYADWEKFDADKECEKVDEDSDSDLTDEFDETVKEEALAQKEAGNRHVKNGKWDEAIKCYTKAIDYYPYDPVFHANRALCYLKKNEMAKAEADCAISLKLDNTYVKAYQRRAAAREALNKLDEAKQDLMRVLELEPKNSESRNNLEKLKKKIGSIKKDGSSETQRPISKFSASRQHKKVVPTPEVPKQVETEKPQTYWPSGDNVALVKAIKKPPHMRSKKPLKRIQIKEINSATPKPEVEPDTRWPQKGSDPKSINIEDMKIIERKQPETIPQKLDKETKNLCNFDKISKIKSEVDIQLETPKTYVQFHSTWKKLKDQNDKKYEYLKLLNPQKIPEIFRESLESHVFSDILFIMSEYFIKNNDSVYEYLLCLSKIQRFGTFTMFLTLSDKNCLWKMFNYMKERSEGQCKDVDDLLVKYELK